MKNLSSEKDTRVAKYKQFPRIKDMQIMELNFDVINHVQ